MARRPRSGLRSFGVGTAVLLGGSLLVAPVAAHADTPRTATPAAATDEITLVPETGGRTAIQVTPASGEPTAPVGFVSTGGTVRAERLDGSSGPEVTAKTGAPAARTSVAAGTTYRTTIRIDSQSNAAPSKSIHLWNIDTWTYAAVDNPNGTLYATADLPPGNYLVAAMYGWSGSNTYLLSRSFTVKDRTQTVALAESATREVALKADDPTAQNSANAVWLSMPNGDLVGFSGGYAARTFVSTAAVTGVVLRAHQLLTKSGSTTLRPSPYRYDLTQSWAHPFPASLVSTVKTASLAKTTTTLRAQGVNTTGWYATVPNVGEWTGAYLSTPVRLPATFTEYVTPGIEVDGIARYGTGYILSLGSRTLPAGASADTTVGSAPVAPARRPWRDDSRRTPDQIHVNENMIHTDTDGNTGLDQAAKVSTTLRAGDRVLATADTPGMVVDVPAGEQAYHLEQTATRRVGWSQLSTSIHSDWTFASAGTSTGLLPLIDLAFSASGLDQRNRAGTAPVNLTVVPSTRRTAAATTIETIEWSADDGATWADLPFTASGAGVTASLAVPSTAAFVSLRVTARNADGGALTRTVLRSFAGPATAGDQATGDVTISNVKVNGGRPLNLGTSGTAWVTTTFTASAPSGIDRAGLALWHGAYNAPDGRETATATCTPVSATTANCSASVYLWDVRYLISGNALAGAWQAAVWATAKDGSGYAERQRAGSLVMKRVTRLTTNATPEPVKKGKKITVSGVLTRADWSTGAYGPYAYRTVLLQRFKRGGTAWTNVKYVRTDAYGRLSTTVKATADSSYRYVYFTDATSTAVVSVSDYVDVR
ncbi:hypothetical protein GCM10010112_42580 [Actinoplanes lobatus]|uniref:Putative membrane protein (Fun14 family) n=1 Tax=Actinoplanes lobatus TaxID=113568 RepID=A0A7W7HBW7_9ACTN|nr:hypothetical protein [Actinoplanes lobatus]MBB4747699.1 putative membrane protein (Fun14 family) [Actinoplanes lobatus]GGN73346.1 hypothetical protein GCM10010112_42580 [Actinoplanes lobatus]GIE39737.1 hypothetical protein Alo02nite_26350 [Actinoplanes lobatus]